MVEEAKRPRVVIVGAGFGGISAARVLARSRMDVKVIDRNNYHTFQPLLYQVAAAELEPEAISHPVRSILRNMPNVQFMMGTVQSIDLSARQVKTTDRVVPYDFLVLATGSVSRFFSVPGVAENTFELKTLDHAIALRNHIMCCFEKAALESVPNRHRLLTFVIIGGGPTGVEFAGALSELIQGPIAKDYPMFGANDVNIILVEGADSLLPQLGKSLRDYTLRHLRRIGVHVILRTAVTQVDAGAVLLGNGTTIPTDTVVWTAGVRGDHLAEVAGLPVARDFRVFVLPTLQVPGHPELYAIGDLAYWEEKGQPLAFVAPVAIQQGKVAALNIKRQVDGQNLLPFQSNYRKSAVVIGRMAAVIQVGRYKFTGLIAWVLWLLVHIFNIIGFRNRLLVMINWAWDFLFYERGIRLILPSEACSGLRNRSPAQSPGQTGQSGPR